MKMFTEEAPIEAPELYEMITAFIQLEPYNRIRALGAVSCILAEQNGEIEEDY